MILLFFLETLREQPGILVLTETWLSEEDNLAEFEKKSCLPIESRHRKSPNRRSGKNVFSVESGIEYYPIHFESDIECQSNEVEMKFVERIARVKVFCVKYRPDAFPIIQLLPELDILLHFLKSLRPFILILVFSTLILWKTTKIGETMRISSRHMVLSSKFYTN